MGELLTILNQPITQFAGLIGIVFALQRGGVDIGGIVRSFLGIRGSEAARDIDDASRNALQTIIFQMENLAQHYNHETTDELVAIRKAVEALLANQANGMELLRAFDKYGVKSRKD